MEMRDSNNLPVNNDALSPIVWLKQYKYRFWHAQNDKNTRRCMKVS